jgi:hypothetical protein
VYKPFIPANGCTTFAVDWPGGRNGDIYDLQVHLNTFPGQIPAGAPTDAEITVDCTYNGPCLIYNVPPF